MQPITRTEKLPLLPVLAGAMILIPFLLFAGCTGQAPGPRLEGTGWTLTGYLHNGTVVPADTGNDDHAGFRHRGQNQRVLPGVTTILPPTKLKGTGITIGQAGSTMMYCSAPGVMDQESSLPYAPCPVKNHR